MVQLREIKKGSVKSIAQSADIGRKWFYTFWSNQYPNRQYYISTQKNSCPWNYGTGGAGKSSLVDEIISPIYHRWADKKLEYYPLIHPEEKTGRCAPRWSVLEDSVHHHFITRVYALTVYTSIQSRPFMPHIEKITRNSKACQFDLVILETSGIGRSDRNCWFLLDCIVRDDSEYGCSFPAWKNWTCLILQISLQLTDSTNAVKMPLRDVKKKCKGINSSGMFRQKKSPFSGTIRITI